MYEGCAEFIVNLSNLSIRLTIYSQFINQLKINVLTVSIVHKILRGNLT